MAFINSIPFLFMWWYSDGLQSLFNFFSLWFTHTSSFFAPLDLVKNIFAPWKKDIGQKGRGLSDLKTWFADNLVSRLMGFVMRFSLLIVYLVFLVSYFLFLGLGLVFWLAMPLWVALSIFWIFI